MPEVMMLSLCLTLPASPKSTTPAPTKNLKPLRRSFSFSPLPYREQRNPERLSNRRLRRAITELDLKSSKPQVVTYSLLLKDCIRSRNYELGQLLHQKLVESGLELDSVLHNSLISLYSKCGNVEKAFAVFGNMGSKRDLVSWSAMISCYANNGMKFEAILTFLDMLEHGFYPNEYCFTAVMRACSNEEYFSIGKIVFGFVIKSGYFDSDVCVGCELIDMFVKGGRDIDSAWEVFEKMHERNVVTWTLMITRLIQMGLAIDAIYLFTEMVSSGYEPDRFTLSGVLSSLSSCAGLEMLSMGKQLHSFVIRLGLATDVCVACSLVDMYAKCTENGTIESSRKVFDSTPEHNVMSWTAILTGYVQNGEGSKEAIKLFCKMLEGHVTPNHFTFSAVLKTCANLSDSCIGEQVHGLTIKRGLSSVNCVGNSLINMYSRSGRVEDARKAFDVLFEKNLISYNTIVDAYVKTLDSEEALRLFHEIGDTDFHADPFTFASLLSGAASIGAVSQGEQMHARVIKSGFGADLCVSNALISMYSRCGNIEAAFKVFSDMHNQNVISWTSIISGFAKHGFAAQAIEIFHEMLQNGIKPNELTYIAVLSACSHVGFINEGWELFNSMQREHGIVPRMEHYACMVDLLGRSGSLLEAIEFIASMPFKADPLVWRTFLGACRVHGNSELGELAAKKILELEPNDSAAHILLSNLYASEGRWEDVAAIRGNMKQKKLTKEAGCSWIEVEGKVHKFHVADTSHPLAKEIYDELDTLSVKIKKLGYVPITDFVLHDVEDEQKKQYLFQHSEKIAVAFGLLNTPTPKPIRIFKNLRICGDCHSAIKYISSATGREIVIRDSNRFHRFRNGTCSYNDYW